MSFAFELGKAAAKRREAQQQEQVEPLFGGDFLAEWRRGYGGEGKPCQRSVSTAGTATDRSAAVASAQGATARASVSPTDTKPQKQATLFGSAEPEKPKPRESTQTGIRPKPPTPVPLADVDQEIAALVAIGIGLSEADELVRKGQWTLDQMVCQWQLGNEAGLPQHVIGRVARYGQQRWGAKKCEAK